MCGFFSKLKCFANYLLIFIFVKDAVADSPLLDSSQDPGWGGAVAGLILQANASNLTYAVYTEALPVQSPNWYQKLVKPEYRGAFDVELKYNFSGENTINDLARLNWLHYYSDNSTGFASKENGTSVGPTYYYGPKEQDLLNTSAGSDVKFYVDQVNLIYGHIFNVTKKIQLKPHLGISIAHLKENITNTYNGIDPSVAPYYHQSNLTSSFTGFAPRARIDVNYFIKKNFGITAEFAGNLFVGNLSSKTTFKSFSGLNNGIIPDNVSPTITTLANQHVTAVFPELDSEIGFFYNVSSIAKMNLTLQAGYAFWDYLNSIYQVLPTTLVPEVWELGTVATINQSYQRSDLSLNGPYLRLSLK